MFGPPVLDRAALLEAAGGERALALEVLDLFLRQCGTLLPALDGTGPARDRGWAAHTLKGAAAAVGAGELAAAADGIERLTAEGAGTAEHANAFRAFEMALLRLRQDLAKDGPLP